jgi:membrane-bound metal-dependent hydrolase YbcI (DUF457 family)
MAGFKTHVTVSSFLGIGYGLAASFLGDFSPVQGALAGCLTGVSGMLPDLDSDSGRPIQEIFSLTAAVAPAVMMRRLNHWGGGPEGAALLAILLYIGIRYGAATILQMITVHRGMYHSFPALLIAAELTFLGYQSDVMSVKLLMAGGVAAGFVSHLILDEIYSVQWNGMRIKLKSSAGTAMKWVGNNWTDNIITYGLLFTLSYGVLVDGGVLQKLQNPTQQTPMSLQQATQVPAGQPVLQR